jgi:hypothetical protein
MDSDFKNIKKSLLLFSVENIAGTGIKKRVIFNFKKSE